MRPRCLRHAGIKKSIETIDLEDAIDRILAGPEKKNRLINEQEKRIVAVHESGHALTALLLPNTDPVTRVSIIPRGVCRPGIYTTNTKGRSLFDHTIGDH